MIIVKKQADKRDAKGNVIEKALTKGEVYRKLLKDNKHRPIMVHCGYSGYYQSGSETCLSFQMRKAKKTFYWAFMDEAHRTLGADWGSWCKIHDDSICFVKHRFMPTATPDELTSAKKDYNKIYGLGIYSDVSFPPLDNVEAFHRGYIRAYKVFQLSFSVDDLPTDIFTKLDEGREPYISIINTRQDLVIPYKYYMELKTFYTFKMLYPNINHTLGVTNRINNSRLYKKFIEAVKKPMLLRMFDGNYNNPEYKRLLNIHVKAMTTDVDDNKELRAMADRIGRDYKDSLILHCNLLGEGWNPGNTLTEKDKKYKGFVDSIQFIDNVNSKRKIAQNCGRGVRSPFYKPNCWVITSWLNIDYQTESSLLMNYNKRADKLHDVATALGIPKQFVHDNIILKTCKPITKPDKGGGTGPDNIDGDIEIDPFTDHFLEILKFGESFGIYEHYEEVIDFFQSEHEKRDCRYIRSHYIVEKELIFKETESKFPEFTSYMISSLVRGTWTYLSPHLIQKVRTWEEKNEKVSNERISNIKAVIIDHVKNSFKNDSNHYGHISELYEQFDFVKKYVDLGYPRLEYTRIMDKKIHDLFPESVYVKNRQQVKKSILDFFQNKIDNQQFDKSMIECYGFERKSRSHTGLSGKANELRDFIFKQTNIKVNPNHLHLIIMRRRNHAKCDLLFNQKELEIFTEFEKGLSQNAEMLNMKKTMPTVNKCIDILISTKDDFDSNPAWKKNASKLSGLTMQLVEHIVLKRVVGLSSEALIWYNYCDHPRKEELAKIAEYIAFKANSMRPKRHGKLNSNWKGGISYKIEEQDA